MVFSDVVFTTEGIVVISGLIAGLVSALVYIHTQLMKSKEDQLALYKADSDKQLKDEESQKKSYKEIAEEAVAMHESRLAREREREGKEAVKKMAAIVPEHNSPVSKEQQDTADLQTLRARVTAVGLELGLPPREPGPSEESLNPTVDGINTSVEKLKADVSVLKDGQLRADIADVKKDTAAILKNQPDQKTDPKG